jgi:hypothetical protein
MIVQLCTSICNTDMSKIKKKKPILYNTMMDNFENSIAIFY